MYNRMTITLSVARSVVRMCIHRVINVGMVIGVNMVFGVARMIDVSRVIM